MFPAPARAKNGNLLAASWHNKGTGVSRSVTDQVRVKNEFCSPWGLMSFTHDKWHIVLQSENVFELEGIAE